jgi:hypothetical protein
LTVPITPSTVPKLASTVPITPSIGRITPSTVPKLALIGPLPLSSVAHHAVWTSHRSPTLVQHQYHRPIQLVLRHSRCRNGHDDVDFGTVSVYFGTIDGVIRPVDVSLGTVSVYFGPIDGVIGTVGGSGPQCGEHLLADEVHAVPGGLLRHPAAQGVACHQPYVVTPTFRDEVVGGADKITCAAP